MVKVNRLWRRRDSEVNWFSVQLWDLSSVSEYLYIATTLMVSKIHWVNSFTQTAADFWFSMLQLWNLQTLDAHFFGGQITLFSTKPLLDMVRLEMVPVTVLHLLITPSEFVCSLGLLARKKGTLYQPRFWSQPLFHFPRQCCCWHFSHTANAACVGFLLTQFI